MRKGFRENSDEEKEDRWKQTDKTVNRARERERNGQTDVQKEREYDINTMHTSHFK